MMTARGEEGEQEARKNGAWRKELEEMAKHATIYSFVTLLRVTGETRVPTG